jgi:hypothetical protein
LRHIYRRSLYDKNNKVLFIPIPKNASTSIENFLIGKTGHEVATPSFSEIKTAQAQCRLHKVQNSMISAFTAYKNSTKFTIIRDPIERFISAHNMIFTIPDFRTAMERKTDSVITQENSLAVIVKYLQKTIIPDAHFLPQSYFLSAATVDCVVRLERDNISDTLAKCGLGYWISGFSDEKFNVSKSISTKLNAEQFEFLYKYYRSDYELFEKTDKLN